MPRLFAEDVERICAFDIPFREYFAFHGALADLAPRPWSEDDRLDQAQSPTIFWPESRTWLVASEIDLFVTVVGGPRSLIDGVLAHPSLLARRVEATDEIQPSWDLDDPFDED
ncbi:hypothetical protein [Demetria terragena]|uniref:hypothetical protein n=1 Tax=Demetria terragena TaxID=63959 RepID=UPI0012EA1569|nr:hypothetical protein [Demetria terragena]